MGIKNESAPFFLFLGGSDHEGVTSQLRAGGAVYRKKRLESKLENWDSIVSMLEDPLLKGVLVKLNGKNFEQIFHEFYRPTAKQLFGRIGKLPHSVFIHQSLLDNKIDEEVIEDGEDDDFFSSIQSSFQLPSLPIRKFVLQLLDDSKIEVLPYVTNADVTVMATTFIEQVQDNLILRLYIPSDQMWAKEREKMISLFRDFAGRVSNREVRLDQKKMKHGTMYEFFGEQNALPAELTDQLQKFYTFFDLCMSNPLAATNQLKQKGFDHQVVEEIIGRYSKEGRRLKTDLKQERERRIQSIRHRLESELIDECTSNESFQLLSSLIEQSVPTVQEMVSLAQQPIMSSQSNLPIFTAALKPVVLDVVARIVSEEISGGRNLNEDAQILIEMVSQYGAERIVKLVTAVNELENSNLDKGSKIIAKNLLKGFLSKSASKIGDVLVASLTKYLESKF